MRPKAFVLSAFLIWAISLSSQTTPVSLKKSDQDLAYSQEVHRLQVDGQERLFIVLKPKRVIEKKLPVVFFFHGGSPNSTAMSITPEGWFGPLLAKENFIAVHPDGWKGFWNDGRIAQGNPAYVDGVDDVKFARLILENLERNYNIDRTRVFSSGFSNGGIFSHRLAAEAADLFAGVASIAGGLAEPLSKDFKPSRPISLFVIHGDVDRAVPIEGGTVSGQDRHGRIIATGKMLSLYLEHNEIAGEPLKHTLPDLVPDDGIITERWQYEPGKEGVCVQFDLIRNGGHRIPGLDLNRSNNAKRDKAILDYNAFEAIWDFFKNCTPRKPSLENGN